MFNIDFQLIAMVNLLTRESGASVTASQKNTQILMTMA